MEQISAFHTGKSYVGYRVWLESWESKGYPTNVTPRSAALLKLIVNHQHWGGFPWVSQITGWLSYDMVVSKNRGTPKFMV